MNNKDYGATNTSATFLVVDDEPDICFVLEKILARLGYKALVTTNALDGIELYRKQAASIQGIFLDLSMHDMHGYDALQMFRTINPAVRVIVMSGYNDFSESTARQYPATTFLHKPFLIDDIKTKLAAFGV